MSKYQINPITGSLDKVVDSLNLTQNITQASEGGYEFTGGFTDRTSGQSGANDVGTDVEFTSAMVSSGQWLRFGFDATQQLTNDKPYWSRSADPDEAPGAIYSADSENLPSGYTMDGSNAYPDAYQGTGLFSGAYMPADVTSMFNFTDNVITQPNGGTGYNAASVSGDLQYNAATGSYNMSECKVGDFCQFRFDFNLTPQFANTTVEIGLIWQNRDASLNSTFTFTLTGEPLFYGSGTTGQTFLNRPIITAYLASDEDVKARALPAIRADQPVFIQPLTTLFTIGR